MKIKNKSILIISFVALCTLLAFRLMAEPQAQITFHVIDDSGKPVQNIVVTASTFDHHEAGEGFGHDIYKDYKGTTDEKGLATVTFPSAHGDCKYGIYKMPGFYPTVGLEYQFKNAAGNKWQPWNPVMDVIFKPIIKPIPMFARRLKPLEIPALNQPFGFDLAVGDWVAPNGKGIVSDLVFTLTQSVPFVSPSEPFHATLKVSFSNKGDGIQSILMPINVGSELRLPRYAPENGYQETLVKEMGRPAEGKPIDPGSREDQNYFFRVRTVMDENGKITSAIYGKIEGDINAGVMHTKTGHISFVYFFNPNPNDRNMEYGGNLFKNLSSTEQP